MADRPDLHEALASAFDTWSLAERGVGDYAASRGLAPRTRRDPHDRRNFAARRIVDFMRQGGMPRSVEMDHLLNFSGPENTGGTLYQRLKREVTGKGTAVAYAAYDEKGNLHADGDRPALVTAKGTMAFATGGELRAGPQGLAALQPYGGSRDPVQVLRKLALEGVNPGGALRARKPDGHGTAHLARVNDMDAVIHKDERGRVYRDPAEGPAVEFPTDEAESRYTMEPGFPSFVKSEMENRVGFKPAA